MNWLEKKTGPPAKTLATAADAEKLTEEKSVVIIGFFKDAESDEAKTFLSVADANDDLTFAITTEKAVKDKYEVTKDSAVVLIKSFDEGRADYEGKMEKDVSGTKT